MVWVGSVKTEVQQTTRSRGAPNVSRKWKTEGISFPLSQWPVFLWVPYFLVLGTYESENGGPSEPKAMEGRVCQVVKIVLQNLQKHHWKREPPLRQDGPGQTIRRLHACMYSSLYPPFSLVFPFICLCYSSLLSRTAGKRSPVICALDTILRVHTVEANSYLEDIDLCINFNSLLIRVWVSFYNLLHCHLSWRFC